MTESIQAVQPAKSSLIFRYGFLAVCILLVCYTVRTSLALPKAFHYERYAGVVVPIMLLLNHLAYQFPWPRLLGLILKGIAVAWISFGSLYLFYVFYLSDRLGMH